LRRSWQILHFPIVDPAGTGTEKKFSATGTLQASQFWYGAMEKKQRYAVPIARVPPYREGEQEGNLRALVK
jgi:hypothetical protein